MISHRPIFLNEDKLSEEVHPKFIYGYKGWLFVLTGLLFLFGFLGLYRTFSNFSEYAYSIPGRNPIFLWFVSLLHSLLPFLIAVALYFKREGSLFIAKLGVLLFPFVDYFAGIAFETLPEGLETGTTFVLLISSAFVVAPPFLYLTFSRRVKNTYMFWNRLLPTNINCPFCLATIHPKEQERIKKEAICPSCSRLVSRMSIAG